MTEAVIKLRLNQQQLELMDRTIAQGIAADRVSLVRLALREYAAARQAEGKTEPAR
jgi:Arc/MetJ-type ribon-helix-helix transcriptional regulator